MINDNTRQISKAYTGYTSDQCKTWEKKTITYDGDTARNYLNNDKRRRIYDMNLWLGAGSNTTSGTLSTTWTSYSDPNRAVGQVNLADSTDNEWYVTGVQLEAGTSASDFEFLPVDVNLRRCQRYFIKEYDLVEGDYHCYPGKGQGGSAIRFNFFMSCILRASPSIIQSGNGWRSYSDGGVADSSNTATVLYYKVNTAAVALSVTGFSGITDNEIYNISLKGPSASLDLDAEL